jgi:predicted ester cyclase
MSDNTQTVRRMFDEVVNQGRLELIDELYDPEFTTEGPMGTLDLDAFRGFVQGWVTGFPDIRCEVSDLVAQGDRVAWTVRARGTHGGEFLGMPATGRPVDFLSMNVAEFRDGRALRHRVLMDMATLLGQLGEGATVSAA